VLHLQIRDGRATTHAPVDQIDVAIDVTLLVQLHEDLDHRLLVGLVHGEALRLVITGAAQALQLMDDGGAVPAPPLPHPLLEGFPADIFLPKPLGRQLTLDLVLSGDAGMVGPYHPEGVEPP